MYGVVVFAYRKLFILFTIVSVKSEYGGGLVVDSR